MTKDSRLCVLQISAIDPIARRTYVRLLLFILFFFVVREVLAEVIAFERDDAIWIANTDGSGSKKLCKGSAPSFSPDGKHIAFHTDTSTSGEVIRQIATADVATGKIAVFHDGIPSRNCQEAVWSPDGTRIVFNIFDGSEWHLAIINTDGSNFRYVRKSSQAHPSVWSICWARDSQSLYCQDLDNIYQLTADGTELKKWSINSMFPKVSLTSASAMSLAPDGNTLVIDVEMDETATNLTKNEGPPSAIWIYNLSANKAERITKPGLSSWHPCWLNNSEILFSTEMRKEKTPSIYKINISTKQQTRILQNANNPVASFSTSR
jgi:TolB protein